MKINTAEEFWEALEACKNFAQEHEEEHGMLLCVSSHGERVGFLVSGKGSDVVNATCCALDNDDAFREIWSAVSVVFAKASAKVKVVNAQTVGEFPVTPSKIKS